MSKIKTVFGFDMETDVGSWASTYEGMQHGSPIILEILKKHDVKATFFFTADAAEKNLPPRRFLTKAEGRYPCRK